MREQNPHARRSLGREQHRAYYAAYIQSAEWFRRRDQWVIDERSRTGSSEIRCFGCGNAWRARTDDMHHCTYQSLGDEAHDDLWPLCRPCHTLLHEVMRSSRSWRRNSAYVANHQALAIVQQSQNSAAVSVVSPAAALKDFL